MPLLVSARARDGSRWYAWSNFSAAFWSSCWLISEVPTLLSVAASCVAALSVAAWLSDEAHSKRASESAPVFTVLPSRFHEGGPKVIVCPLSTAPHIVKRLAQRRADVCDFIFC